MPNQINSNSTQKTYTALDMLDLSELAVNDVKWLNIAISHLKREFYKLKANTQEQYKIHDCHFEELAEFFGMYEYLADDRLEEQQRLAEKYQTEANQAQGGNRNA